MARKTTGAGTDKIGSRQIIIKDSTPDKFCWQCRHYYPATLDYFHSNVSRYDGLCPECKKCANINRRQRKIKARLK